MGKDRGRVASLGVPNPMKLQQAMGSVELAARAEVERGARRHELITRFIRLQVMGGTLSIVAALCAMIVANGSWAPLYFRTLQATLGPLSVLGWINDVLMPGFFLILALRLKREWCVGQLSTPAERRFTIVAAFSGSAVPAAVLIYFAETGYHWLGLLIASWAAGLAWALAVASLLDGKLLPQVRIALAMIVILGDFAAVALSTLVAPSQLHAMPVIAVAGLLVVMLALARKGVSHHWPYGLALLCVWPAAWSAGLPLPAIAVVAGLLVPVRPEFERLEYRVHKVVAIAVLPLFAFANLGLAFGGLVSSGLGTSLTVALVGAMFVGKPLGIVAGTRAAVAFGVVSLPPGLSWLQLCGIAALCGIGGTSSLLLGLGMFVGSSLLVQLKLAVLLASLLSAVVGYALLRRTVFRRP